MSDGVSKLRMTVVIWWESARSVAEERQAYYDCEYAIRSAWLASILPIVFHNRNNPEGRDTVCWVIDSHHDVEGQSPECIRKRLLSVQQKYCGLMIETSTGAIE